MPVARLGGRLRFLLREFHKAFDQDAEAFPEISEALRKLEEAVSVDLPPSQKRRRGRDRTVGADLAAYIKRLRNQLQYAKRSRAALKATLSTLKTAKDREHSNRTAAAFAAKIALASPGSSARSFAAALSDLIGTGSGSCSRRTIARVRDAFTFVCKDLYYSRVEQRVRDALAASAFALAAAPAPALNVVVLHYHDEATLRLRSANDVTGAPSRGRASKILQHSVWIYLTASEQKLAFPTELVALANKSAVVLARALFEVLQAASSRLAKGATASSDSPRIWLTHVLVGDGIPTNEAAARILLAWAERDLRSVVYLLFVTKCASHQTNLAIGAAVTGVPALCACENTAALVNQPDALERRKLHADEKGHPHRSVCGVIVRLFKYLINYYYDEFLMSLRTLVGKLEFGMASDPAALTKWSGMAELYGESVIPPMLLRYLNKGLDVWAHATASAPAASAPAAAEVPESHDEVRAALVETLRRRLLVVDEHPTLTRFFTFKGHIDALLLLSFMGVAPAVFKLGTVKALLKNSSRLRSVLAFLDLPSTPQYLRRTALALDVLDHTHRICGQVYARGDGDPLLVRIARGGVVDALDADLASTFRRMHLDASLDVGAAVILLLQVAIDTFVRFQQYERYPCLAYKLCRKYCEHWRVNCLDFLSVADEELDTGFSLKLKRCCRLGKRSRNALSHISSFVVHELEPQNPEN